MAQKNKGTPPENISPPLKPRGPGFVLAFILIAAGIITIMIPTTPDRRTTMILAGVISIFLGLAQLNRTIGPPRS